MELTQENIRACEQDIVEPDQPPHSGSLKESRLSRFLRYGKIENQHVRVLQIIIDHGPICCCLIAAYAGLSVTETQKIINYLTSYKVKAVEIYADRPVEGYQTDTVPLYHCPSGM